MATKSASNKKSVKKPKSPNLSPSKLSKSRFNLWAATLIGVVIAGIGLYLIFSAKAAGSTCDAVTGGFICNINQAYNRSDSIQDAGSGEVAAKVTAGWTNWGVAFRAPNFARNGALPVHRFYNATNTSHRLAIETSQTYINLKADPTHNLDEGIFFWAWKTAGQADTKPIYELKNQVSGASEDYYKYIDYPPTSTELTSGGFINGGITFYAYAANYVAPPLNGTVSPTPTPTRTATPTPTAAPVSVISPTRSAAIIAALLQLSPTDYQAQSTEQYPIAPPIGDQSIRLDNDVEADQYNRINQERAAVGMPGYARTACMDAAAREWTLNMIGEHLLHHSTNWPWIQSHCGGQKMFAAENVAMNYNSLDLHVKFMNSPHHRDNILRDYNVDPRTHAAVSGMGWIGIGAYWFGDQLWVAQNFIGCDKTCAGVYSASSY